jgi:hypothetical protein
LNYLKLLFDSSRITLGGSGAKQDETSLNDQRVLRLDVAQRGQAIFVNFTRVQRSILADVFNAIYQSTDDLQKGAPP